MSYCRFINADVYLFPTDRAGLAVVECCGCIREPKRDWYSAVEAEILEHLAYHRRMGDEVPAFVDLEIHDDFVANRCGLGAKEASDD